MTQPRTAITAIRSPCRSKEPGRRWEHDTAIEHNELPMPVNMNSLARKDGHRRTEHPGCHGVTKTDDKGTRASRPKM
jgi:hypothetical protein